MGLFILKHKEKRALILNSINITKIEITIGVVLSILSGGVWFILLQRGLWCPTPLILGPLIIWGVLLGKSISQIFDDQILWKEVLITELRLGDKLKDPITLGGKDIVPKRSQGISQEDIEMLTQEFGDQLISKTLSIRYGIPGIPAFLLAMLITVVFGDLVMTIMAMMACFGFMIVL
jgi:hypothetical protein